MTAGALNVPAREVLLCLSCVLSDLGVSLAGGSRSRAEGDRCIGKSMVGHPLGKRAARESKACP